MKIDSHLLGVASTILLGVTPFVQSAPISIASKDTVAQLNPAVENSVTLANSVQQRPPPDNALTTTTQKLDARGKDLNIVDEANTWLDATMTPSTSTSRPFRVFEVGSSSNATPRNAVVDDLNLPPRQQPDAVPVSLATRSQRQLSLHERNSIAQQLSFGRQSFSSRLERLREERRNLLAASGAPERLNVERVHEPHGRIAHPPPLVIHTASPRFPTPPEGNPDFRWPSAPFSPGYTPSPSPSPPHTSSPLSSPPNSPLGHGKRKSSDKGDVASTSTSQNKNGRKSEEKDKWSSDRYKGWSWE